MIHNLKLYSTRKNSGVPWLGEIPVHWETSRAKWLFRKMERSVKSDDDVVTCFRDGGVTFRKNRRVRGYTESLKEIGYQGILQGDLVIHTMDAFAGAAGVSDSDGKGTSVYSVCTPRNERVNPYYYAFCVREMARSEWILALAKGIRERSTDFRFNVFASQIVPFPPLPEQNAIVRFLDYTNRHIRRYIHAKQKLIVLLEEQKQAIIQQAITGKIDVSTGQPYQTYKPSGIEWLGTVPAHWEVRRLRDTVEGCINGIWGNDPNGSDDLTCVRVADFDRKRWCIKLTKPTLRAIAPSERRHRLLRKGDLLLEKSGGGDLQPVGVVVVYNHNIEAVCSNFVARMLVSSSFKSSYLKYLHSHLYAIRLNVRSIKQTTGIQNLDLYSYLSERVSFPPFLEQTAIVDYLDRETVGIDDAITRAHRQIRLLNEYRTCLIANVVTGKFDVRESAAAQPEVNPLAVEDTLDRSLDTNALYNQDGFDATLEYSKV